MFTLGLEEGLCHPSKPHRGGGGVITPMAETFKSWHTCSMSAVHTHWRLSLTRYREKKFIVKDRVIPARLNKWGLYPGQASDLIRVNKMSGYWLSLRMDLKDLLLSRTRIWDDDKNLSWCSTWQMESLSTEMGSPGYRGSLTFRPTWAVHSVSQWEGQGGSRHNWMFWGCGGDMSLGVALVAFLIALTKCLAKA